MEFLKHLTAPRLATLALVASLALLAGAHAFETFGGLEPCPLCLRQREAHWTAAAISALALVCGSRPQWHGMVVWLFGALTAAYLVGAGIAAYHAGVEWHWWAGPASCATGADGGVMSAADLFQRLQESADVPACDEVPWSLLGISMAGYNVLFSLMLAILSFLPVFGQLSVSGLSRKNST